MQTAIELQNKRLAAHLGQRVKGWWELTPENRDAWIAEVLDTFAERGEYEIGSRESVSGNPEVIYDNLSDRYLSRAEVAERIGVAPSTLSRYKLPEADAMIGDVRGWRVSTIDAWNAARPGRGNWS